MWSYNASALATSAKDRVRLAIGDTIEKDQLLQDEEIARALAVETSSEDSAAALCCDWISRLFLRRANVTLGRSLKVEYTKTAEQWKLMATGFRSSAAASSSLGLPYVGGRVLAEKEATEADAGLVQPIFTKARREAGSNSGPYGL